jgi:hypothetical protein
MYSLSLYAVLFSTYPKPHDYEEEYTMSSVATPVYLAVRNCTFLSPSFPINYIQTCNTQIIHTTGKIHLAWALEL